MDPLSSFRTWKPLAELTVYICKNAQVIIPKDVKSIQVVDFSLKIPSKRTWCSFWNMI
jgi:hypothetical protein